MIIEVNTDPYESKPGYFSTPTDEQKRALLLDQMTENFKKRGWLKKITDLNQHRPQTIKAYAFDILVSHLESDMND